MSAKQRAGRRRRLIPWLVSAPVGQLLKLLNSRARWIVVSVALVGGLAVGGHWAWRHYRAEVLGREEYLVRTDDIVVTSQPTWISAETDVRAEVVRDASLEGDMSLLDEELTERVSKAFALHPWIRRVERVTKHYPSRVVVQLQWRRPVCMIDVDGRLQPVDQQGILLPSGDFSPKTTRRYPRVAGIQSAPVGPVGTPWGDPRVEGAARIAAALVDIWPRLGLDRLVASRTPSEGPAGYDYTYDLFTRGGTRIFWGFAPDDTEAGASSAAEKTDRLRALVAEHGSLDGVQAGSYWDLSNRGKISLRPGTINR